MYKKLVETINGITNVDAISEERKTVLQPLIGFVQQKAEIGEDINLNFICTHNSRRSHLAQVWAQMASAYFNIPNVRCYSGGTEETTLFPKVAETLIEQGFDIFKVAETDNPIYAIKYSENALPVIGFSKRHDHPYNPLSAFAAVMTCSQADRDCPFIVGAERRISVPYDDPKISDGTPGQSQIYAERSLQIATEMCYVFSRVKN